MRNRKSLLRPGMAAGFTLPAILVVAGALLILAVGILLVVGIERSTARSFVDRQRADLAARAGLEDIRGILNQEAANDDFVVLQSTLANPITTGKDSAPQLFIARGKSAGSSYSYRYVPLFSTLTQPATNSTLAPPQIEPLVGTSDTEWFEFNTLPYTDKVRTAWLPVLDEKGRTVARYAYWVEDLQGRVDPKIAGNDKGTGSVHARAKYPFPAPGLNDLPLTDKELALNQIALYAVDPAATEDQQGTIGKSLLKNRGMLLSPDSSLAAAGIAPPITRDATGHQVDPKARAIEENLTPNLQSYLEQPLVPFADGIDASVSGKPKLNLNKLLATGGDSAVSEMSTFIKKALPKFEDRKGGFPDDYLKTLAANALDYADKDNEPTATTTYRGLDAYPLVSEFLMRFSWDSANTGDITFSVSTYAELWNMTDKPVTGDFQLSYETGYSFKVGLDPEGTNLSDLSSATPKLESSDGYNWFPKINVSLKPNEYRVFKCGTLTYKWSFGSFVPSPITLGGDSYGRSKAGYHMKWNNVMVDQARGYVHRNDCSLYYKVPGKFSMATRCTVPGHSYSNAAQVFTNNMGDPRMCFYLKYPQDANAYPDNYSPNRRNVRWGTIYKGDSANKPKIFGRVMPSEWPDGGHNSTLESIAYYTEDVSVDPMDNRFFPSASSVLRNPPIEEAPMRLSNLGRFYSATELGRVYDPLMWENAPPTGANLPYGDVKTTSASSPNYGGGNTLRIGRPEHPRFDVAATPGLEAYHLLDLFHTGQSLSTVVSEREGLLTKIQGQINLNTANRDALRAIAVGALTMDPKLSLRSAEAHNVGGPMAPPLSDYKLTPAEINVEANRIADAIIQMRKLRPFPAPSAVAEIVDPTGKPVFGNKDLLPNGTKVERTDSAAEEIFARVYEASTVRSRNFRIWVVGQALTPVTGTSTSAKPEVLAEVRRAYTVFADPGVRASDGTVDATKSKLTILHENDF